MSASSDSAVVIGLSAVVVAVQEDDAVVLTGWPGTVACRAPVRPPWC